LIQSVMETGVSGYILKDDVSTFRDLPAVIRSVANQDIYLSPAAVQAIAARRSDELAKPLSNRQLEALSLCSAFPDASTAELAIKMGIAHSTLRNMLSGAYLRLGVRTRTSAILKAKQMGLFPALPDRQDFDISDE
jgi:DNA-binding NarL/FixJ family response regulator